MKTIVRGVAFPYDKEMQPYLKFKSMIENIEPLILLAAKGWAVEKNQFSKFRVQESLSENDYQIIDAIWLIDSIHDIQEDFVLEIVEEMLKHHKQILLSRHFNTETYNRIVGLVEKYSGKYIDLTQKNQNIELDGISLELAEINTPIVCVMGIGERTDKFLTELAVKQYFENQGYNIVLVSSRCNSVFLHNVYSFPAFMNSDIPAEYKIVLYNRFIKNIEQECKPELILTGIPGEIMPISKIQPGHFGVHAFQVLNAINPDFAIMCLYGSSVSDKYIYELKQIVKYRFMLNIDCFYLSSNVQDVFTINRPLSIEYLERNIDDIKKVKCELQKVLSEQDKIYLETEIGAMGQYIIDTLNGNVEMEVL